MIDEPKHDYPKGDTTEAGSAGSSEPNAPDPVSLPPSHFSTSFKPPVKKWAKGSGDHKPAEGMTGHPNANRRSVNQIRADRILITDLMVRGLTLEQMADKLAEVRGYRLHFSTINREVRCITDEYKKRNDDLLDRHRQRQLMRLDAQEQEAWRAWEKSKEDSITKQGERTSGPGQNGANTPTGGREKSLVRQVGRVGNSEFLRVMLAIAERRCKLLGLDAPNRNVLMNPDGTAIQPATPAAVLVLPEEQIARLTDGEAQRLSKEFYKTLSERRYGNGSGNGNGHSPAPSNGNGHNGSNGNGHGNGHGVAVEYDGGEEEGLEEAG